MAQPFFLTRDRLPSIDALFNGASVQFHPDVSKISLISDEKLKLESCTKPCSDITTGIPFDIQAAVYLLKHYGGLKQRIIDQPGNDPEKPIILLCSGSTISDGKKIPYISISGSGAEIGTIGRDYAEPLVNAYQFVYGIS